MDRSARLGAAAGGVGVLLFVAGAVVIGEMPGFDAPAAEIAAHLEENRNRVQLGAALDAAAAPFLVWFLATIASLAPDGAPRRAAGIALGAGIAYVAVFLVDISALAVGALHPENLQAAPELARALRDFEWIAIGLATPLGVAMLAGLASLAFAERSIWPRWIGWLAVASAAAYALRIGTVFSDRGPFAADGALGLFVPVVAFAGWLVLASVTLTLRLRERAPARGSALSSAL